MFAPIKERLQSSDIKAARTNPFIGPSSVVLKIIHVCTNQGKAAIIIRYLNGAYQSVYRPVIRCTTQPNNNEK
jgi:hypothetical protein